VDVATEANPVEQGDERRARFGGLVRSLFVLWQRHQGRENACGLVREVNERFIEHDQRAAVVERIRRRVDEMCIERCDDDSIGEVASRRGLDCQCARGSNQVRRYPLQSSLIPLSLAGSTSSVPAISLTT